MACNSSLEALDGATCSLPRTITRNCARGRQTDRERPDERARRGDAAAQATAQPEHTDGCAFVSYAS
eukprot:2955058-Prymnesium_polylepis.2